MSNTNTEVGDRVAQLYIDGMSTKDIATMVGISEKTCLKELNKRGVELRNKKVKLTEEHKSCIIQMFNENFTIGDIAGKLNLPRSTCRYFLFNAGYDTSKHHKLTTEEQQDTIVEMFRSGSKTSDIAKLLGLSGAGVLKILGKRGEDTQRDAEVKFTAEQEQLIIELYESGVGSEKIAEKLEIAKSSVFNVLKRNNIQTRTISEASRVNSVDESFFDVIDTEAKAYWLGFITADGNVCARNKALSIGLAIKDYGHLEKFLKDINSEAEIKLTTSSIGSKSYESCTVSIYSKKIFEALFNLGVTPKKSLTIKPCEQVPDYLMSSYLRGMFDGDGCISSGTLSFVGSFDIVTLFRHYMNVVSGSKANVRKYRNIFSISYGGRNMIDKILNFMYKDASIYLERKYLLAQKFLEH